MSKSIEEAAPLTVEPAYPTPDTRNERQRELDEHKRKQAAKKVFYTVPWKAGVHINGKEYKGTVMVDEVTRDYLDYICSRRLASEALNRNGDGNSGLHELTGMHSIGLY